ncbi:hypothetical protein C8R46DRAFT_1053478 [Mycena filopes]|nr:hypothetical protein C8R46DRAFT_1053478 [Mycena filopes]
MPDSPQGSPTRPRPPPLRLDHVGINPSDLIGKILKSVRRSEQWPRPHPCLTLTFADGTRVQVRVDGYDAVHKGLPKELGMDESLETLFASDSDLDLTVADCALIKLSDKAFDSSSPAAPVRWDQSHLGVAFKFAAGSSGGSGPWHCVWAVLQDHDDAGECIFRTYDDVYLEQLQRSPRKAKPHRRKSGPPSAVS